MKLLISKIIMDHQAQPRIEINSEVIQEYAEVWKDGAGFPPITVYSDGNEYWLSHGWHRVLSAKVAHIQEIEADVKPGTLRDAILNSVGVNFDNGMRRTNADKRRAVEILLKDPEWAKWSDREIARQAKVSQPLVSDMRPFYLKELSDTRKVQRGNVVYEMQTENIGREQWREDNYSIGLDELGDPLPPKEKELAAEPSRIVSKFNRTNDNIEWAWWSWNPVTGCKHDCEYCYARDIANRFYPEKFEPTYHPERLDAPKNTNPIIDSQGGRSVFVCSMADLFGSWVPNDWINPVLKSVEQNPQWTFIFLTKNPRRLASIQFPANAWVGCTVDTQARVKPSEEAMMNVKATVKFTSCEPMLEPLQFNNLAIFDWVIIGAQSKSTQCPEFQPESWWWIDLANKARQAGCKVYCKPNLTSRPKEYPEGK